MTDLSVANTVYASKAIKQAVQEAVKMDGFSTNFSDELGVAGGVVNVPYVASSTVADMGAENGLLNGDTTMKVCPITLSTPAKASFVVTPDMLNKFVPAQWEAKAELNAKAVINGILSKVATLVADGTKYTNEMEIELANFSLATISDMRTEASEAGLNMAETSLYLAPAYYSKAISLATATVVGDGETIRSGKINGLFGFKAVIEMPALTIAGFIADSSAVCVAGRAYGVPAPEAFAFYMPQVDENTQLPLTLLGAVNQSTGALCHNTILWAGVGAGNTNSLIRVIEKVVTP